MVEVRLGILSDDVAEIRSTVNEHSQLAAERRESFRNMSEDIKEIKLTLASNSAALQALTVGSGIMKARVAWLLAILLFLANFLGQGAGSAVRQALSGGPQQTIQSPASPHK